MHTKLDGETSCKMITSKTKNGMEG